MPNAEILAQRMQITGAIVRVDGLVAAILCKETATEHGQRKRVSHMERFKRVPA
jgi:hypothetical protein